MKNVLVIHGGAPTAVLNASLYGVLCQAAEGDVCHVYGAIGGSEGVLKERFLDMGGLSGEKLEKLLVTPGSAIGTSRYALTPEDYLRMVEILKKWGIRCVLFNGGNGTMDACGKLHELCKREGISVVGIPKTVDNDIAVTDHTPGFGSAARYLAQITAEVGADVKSLPIHVCIIEAMGRNAGWITAASALARKKPGDAPHLIYVPERPFCEEEFLADVKRLYEQQGQVVAVVSEGLKNKEGNFIVPPIFTAGRSVYYGDTGAYLAGQIIRRLGIKARSEKPGICGRSSIAMQSPVDRAEAVLAGKEALAAALAGKSGVMIGFVREDTEDGSYRAGTVPIPIQEVMLRERQLPPAYIAACGHDVTDAFVRWCRPLLGGEIAEYMDFQKIKEFIPASNESGGRSGA